MLLFSALALFCLLPMIALAAQDYYKVRLMNREIFNAAGLMRKTAPRPRQIRLGTGPEEVLPSTFQEIPPR